MKKIILLLLSCVLTGAFTSCENKDVPPPFTYNLKIDVTNASGENLCEQLVDQSIESNKIYIVQNGLYKQRLVGEGVGKPDHLKVRTDNTGHASIYQKYATFNRTTPVIEFYLTCPTIFGDREEHTIVSHWELEKEGRSMVCHKVTVDGKEMPVSYESTYAEYAITIVSDIPETEK